MSTFCLPVYCNVYFCLNVYNNEVKKIMIHSSIQFTKLYMPKIYCVEKISNTVCASLKQLRQMYTLLFRDHKALENSIF